MSIHPPGARVDDLGLRRQGQPKYDECVALEGKADLKGAVAASEAAVAASPDSKFGKQAAEKMLRRTAP